MKLPLWLLDFLIGSPGKAYRRARATEAETARLRAQAAWTGITDAIATLNGAGAVELGRLADPRVPDAREIRIVLDELTRHGLVWGGSGRGKSRFLELLLDAFGQDPTRGLEVIDPKGETVLVHALHAAQRYEALPAPARAAFVARFRVFDLQPGYVTPADLFALPVGMSASLLASLRAAAAVDVSGHEFSDLMAWGIQLLFALAIHLACGLTLPVVRRTLFDTAWRTHTLLPKLTDPQLRDSFTHLDDLLPANTRLAVFRQLDLLLSSESARIGYGLSPAMVRRLTQPSSPQVVLGNFGPSPLRTPAAARAQACNRLIDVLTAASVQPARPRLLVLEEVSVLLRQPKIAEYLLEGSRTLRWKGLGIVCVQQDPSNAIPRETLTALLLNSRWIVAFESSEQDAKLLLPFQARDAALSAEAQRSSFLRDLATLPTQHCYFLRKGIPPLRMRTRDVPDPAKTTAERDRLLAVFQDQIARRSMVRIQDAEREIAAWEAQFLGGTMPAGTPQAGSAAPGAAAPAPSLRTVDDLLQFLRGGDPDSEQP